MTLEQWLDTATHDALARGMDDLVPALEGLARATAVLRAADWNDDASGRQDALAPDADPHGV
jgi:hypothetical protein